MSKIEQKRAALLQEYGLIALAEIVKILNDNKIYYWVDAGTLLGIVRDGGFIENDTDIDISVVIDNPDLLYKILQDNGYNIWYYYDDSKGVKRLIRAEKHNVGIDFEIFIKQGDKYFYDSPRELPKSITAKKQGQYAIVRHEFDANIIENQTKHNFNNIELNIPKDYDNYFSTYYENWKVKLAKKDFITKIFCPVEDYKHHNSKTYYCPEVYLYHHSVSKSTIKLGRIEKLIYSISKKFKFNK